MTSLLMDFFDMYNKFDIGIESIRHGGKPLHL